MNVAHAAVGYGGCSMPGQMCIQGSSMGVDVSVRQNGNTVPQTPSAGVMNVLVPITIGVAAIGAAAVAIPATGAIAIAGDAIAAAGSAAIRNHIIQGVALGAVIAAIGYPSGISLDPNGNVSIAQRNPNQGDSGFDGYKWSGAGGQTAGSPLAACMLADLTYITFKSIQAGTNETNFTCVGQWDAGNGGGPAYWGVSRTAVCVTGYMASGGGCSPDPSAPATYVPATDAQVKSAISANPSSWPQIYNGMGCGPTLALTDGSSSDPCFALYRDSRSGFGVSFSTGGSSWTNNGCAVNSTSCPSATVTTAPTTDSSTKTNADGTKTTTTNTTMKTTTVTGTNDRTNPVEGQTTTTTQTSTTVTNPDGSTTTTTTTTTDQAPPATAGNGNQQQKDQTQPTTATFNGPSQALYTQKSKTFGEVLQAFVSRVQGMPWYSAVSAFFSVSIASASCPSDWTVPATQWNPSLDATPYVCSSSMLTMYRLGGIIVLIVAAWAAFKIAFL
nr:hypothetical protein [Ralstonia pseudosolanacearum]